MEQINLMNMCMIRDGERVLVQNRTKSDWQGIAFPGGHVEDGESLTDAVIREVFEETGLTVECPKLCGVKDYVKKNGTRSLILLYTADRFDGELRSSEEGEVFWISPGDLPGRKLAPGFDLMLRVFLEEELSEMHWARDGDGWILK
ncbi:MAG: 8-oxo-dGTP diphosphatase [Clostridia bacterium]|nr:8-oxo-dGTP diphosphatase [Clostridia bacterium]